MAKKRELPPGVMDIRAPQQPLPHDDDDDDCTDEESRYKINRSTRSSSLLQQLKALGFMGSERFLAENPLEVVSEAVRSYRSLPNKGQVKNPGGLIRWLVKEAMAARAADSGVSDREEEPRAISKKSRAV